MGSAGPNHDRYTRQPQAGSQVGTTQHDRAWHTVFDVHVTPQIEGPGGSGSNVAHRGAVVCAASRHVPPATSRLVLGRKTARTNKPWAVHHHCLAGAPGQLGGQKIGAVDRGATKCLQFTCARALCEHRLLRRVIRLPLWCPLVHVLGHSANGGPTLSDVGPHHSTGANNHVHHSSICSQHHRQ